MPAPVPGASTSHARPGACNSARQRQRQRHTGPAADPRCETVTTELTSRVRIFLAAALLLTLALGGCSTIPADPDDTLEAVTGQTPRVGVSPNPPWTDLPEGTSGAPLARNSV